jgi:hypothetical protein
MQVQAKEERIMIKRYASPGQIRWVGKAWEIRHLIRQEMKRLGENARLADLLPPPEKVAVKRRV